MTTTDQPNPAPLAVGVVEAARLINGGKTEWIYKLVRQKRLPRVPGTRKILIPVAALEKFVNPENV